MRPANPAIAAVPPNAVGSLFCQAFAGRLPGGGRVALEPLPSFRLRKAKTRSHLECLCKALRLGRPPRATCRLISLIEAHLHSPDGLAPSPLRGDVRGQRAEKVSQWPFPTEGSAVAINQGRLPVGHHSVDGNDLNFQVRCSQSATSLHLLLVGFRLPVWHLRAWATVWPRVATRRWATPCSHRRLRSPSGPTWRDRRAAVPYAIHLRMG